MTKSRLGEYALFMVGLALVLLLVGEVFERIALKLDTNEPKVQELLDLQDQSFDVLYMGNSITQQAINPEVIDKALGIRSYNAALGGASYIEQQILLQHYVNNNSPPRLIIYGVAVNREEDLDALRPSVLVELSPEELGAYKSYLRQQGKERSFLFYFASRLAVFRNRTAPERLLKYLIQGSKRVPSYTQGHLVVKWTYPGWEGAHPKHLAGIHAKGLESFLTYAATQEIRVVLIECPNHNFYNDTVEGRQDVLTIIQEHLKENQHFISLNGGEIQLEGSDWAGLNHLNEKGAIKFSQILAPLVQHELSMAGS